MKGGDRAFVLLHKNSAESKTDKLSQGSKALFVLLNLPSIPEEQLVTNEASGSKRQTYQIWISGFRFSTWLAYSSLRGHGATAASPCSSPDSQPARLHLSQYNAASFPSSTFASAQWIPVLTPSRHVLRGGVIALLQDPVVLSIKLRS